ncbi:pyridoxal phosphate-dependent aminotransferase [Helicobacter kayseriensis]|uniref:pyridoxal phosphate-dependent aminotransferase n=1 Tax=Helicobacter kayseriensis TaxID=2905877 RepID=UPI001E516B8E|nr:pyridoxal phosphate-dependent aminotransferase [Helicobacter kayseriensis]MCE3046748.1 pyridoxal phosphate-dependent aminotransferase [Helicobacter kayseriensis]MCE3047950.1 pyridoxal phosphate-dependent aminotransferase [Helicobacter kayseriensis]
MQYSQRALALSPSNTLAISALAQSLAKSGKEIINFSTGEPDFDTPTPIKNKAIEAIENGFSKYTAVSGIAELREAVAQKLLRENQLSYSPKEIIISNGAKHSLFNAMCAILNPHDEVIIPAPYWVSYPEIAKFCQATPVFIPTTQDQNFKITPQQLKASITPRTKLLILNSPSNPTGSLYTQEEFQALGKVLEGSDIWVISDEIYEKLTYSNHFISLASLSSDLLERTITINGLSKSTAMTGWRMGYLACKDSTLLSCIDNLQGNSTSNINSFTQIASIVALSLEEEIQAMKEEFLKRRDLAYKLCSSIPSLSLNCPDGAFYLFININHASRFQGDSMKFSQALLEEQGVALVPGIAFGAEGYVRMSFATSIENLQKGIEKIKDFLES